MPRNRAESKTNRWPRTAGAPPLGALAVLALASGPVAATPAAAYGVCSRTATDAFIACHFEVEDDFWEAKGICRNESDPVERAECSFGSDPELDEGVPEELAELLCNDDCLVTRDFTPLEPEADEVKYYAPGIGLFLEVDREDGEIVQLVECNVEPICDSLPEP